MASEALIYAQRGWRPPSPPPQLGAAAREALLKQPRFVYKYKGEVYPTWDIREPHAHDVLCGRGDTINNHPGNLFFRSLIMDEKVNYLSCTSGLERETVYRRVIEGVRSQSPPGRFLQKDDRTGLWFDIGEKKAKEKTSQAMYKRHRIMAADDAIATGSVDVPTHADRRRTSTQGTSPPAAGQPPISALSYPDYPMRNIRTPHDHDVLFGRGAGCNTHPGNEFFRSLVNMRKRDYVEADWRDEKVAMALRIVETVRNRHPPGRFLRKNEAIGLWYDVGDVKAREKTSQALREGAPVLRAEEEDDGRSSQKKRKRTSVV